MFSWKKAVVGLAAIALAAAAVFFTVQGKGKSNVILISIDTLRPDHLGAYGYSRKTSPNIDAFARQAVLFKSAIAQAPSTAPSHASMFTSVLPSIHRTLFSRRSKMSRKVQTVAEILSEHGFATASFNGGGQLTPELGLNRGFNTHKKFDGANYEQERFSDRIKEALGWMDVNKDKRFFLFLHTYEVHLPYAPEERHISQFGEAAYDGPIKLPLTIEMMKGVNRGEVALNDADRRRVTDLYDAEIAGADEAFQQLIDYLKSSGLYDRTLIILTSDHGEEFDEHGKMAMHSHTLYDELLRIPLIIKFPEDAYSGSVIDSQVRSIDIVPTVLETMGLPLLPAFQGVSLVGLVEGKGSFPESAVSQKDSPQENLPTALRTNEWKALSLGRLYNLDSDPHEKKDVAAAFPEVMKAMQGQIEAIWKLTRHGREKSSAIDEKTFEQLRTLGYVK